MTPGHRLERFLGPPDVLAAVAAGGVCGALARYAIALAYPAPPRDFPWSTFGVNVAGCLLIGLLLAVTEVRSPRGRTVHRLVRPFLATGVLGGFTTFSTHTVEVVGLLAADRVALGVAYVAAMVVTALFAVQLGAVGGRAVSRFAGGRSW